MLYFIPTFIYGQSFQWKEGKSGNFTYKYVENDPTHARFYTLDNGLTVILSPTDKDPRIQAYIAVKAGSKTDPATNTGLAHYLEHIMFKGTDKFGTLDWEKEKPLLEKIDNLYEEYNQTTDDAKRKNIYHQIDSVSGVASHFSIANEYDKMMAEMGAQGTNAFTSFEQTVYTDDVPSGAIDKYLTVQAERFRNPVLRIFHTELEAVYEEKNRSLDSDGNRVFEDLFSELFKNHTYGTQTTIGTIEHLKNPSLLEIKKYLHTYYVPNNMGIILSGDFDPDTVIQKIAKQFGYMEAKPIPKYTFQPESPITAPIVKEIYGPDAESVMIGYRLPGNKDKDALLADLVGNILTNGRAGLIDLNLVKKQKLLRASAFAYTLIDHGVLLLTGSPTSGQTLEEVKALMLEQIDNLKKGNFDDDLIPSIVNNIKKQKIRETETYSSRASLLMDAFTSELDWETQVAYVNNLSKITKADVINFANKYFGDNYVAILKRKGENKDSQKIEKPAITPVETNADKQSPFVKMVENIPTIPSQPVFLDYNKDIQKTRLKDAEVLYVQNKDNELYRLRFRYNLGSLNDLKLPVAAQYLQYLGTDSKSSEQISKEFYKIASSFSVNSSEDYTTVTIEGLQENFEQAIKLYEELVLKAKPDEDALNALKARLSKARLDSKLNKNAILQGLTSYAIYGPNNKFNNTLSDEEINQITAQSLINQIKDLNNYHQTIIYYGPASLVNLTTKLASLHKLPAKTKISPPKKSFSQKVQTENEIYFADYDMVQAETRWLRNTDSFNPSEAATVNVFNNYFGGGMGAIIFQTIRESMALAYSTYGIFVQSQKVNNKNYMQSYVGCQADKFNEATVAMNNLLNDMPELAVNLDLAKGQTKQDIQTERITQDGIIYNYLAARDLGLDYDIRKTIYNNVDKITMADLKRFHQKYLAGKSYNYAIVASEKKVSMADIEKLGKVKKLSLKEIFGY